MASDCVAILGRTSKKRCNSTRLFSERSKGTTRGHALPPGPHLMLWEYLESLPYCCVEHVRLAVAHNVAVHGGPWWQGRQAPDECCHVLHRVTLETHDHIPRLEPRPRGWTVHHDSLDADPLLVILWHQLETEPTTGGLARLYAGDQRFCLSLTTRMLEVHHVIP